jgi:hypothetical protein
MPVLLQVILKVLEAVVMVLCVCGLEKKGAEAN